MATRTLPDAAWLRECVDYDPGTGIFTWRQRPQPHFSRSYEYKRWNIRYAGKLAGRGDGSRHNYWRIHVIGHGQIRAHRLAWLLIHGEPVPEMIDHIDGNPLNNRISNLRAATNSENKMNARRRTDNRSGVKGVFLARQGYVAYVTVRGDRYHLGTFDTLQEAAEWRRAWAAYLHKRFVHHG